MRCGFTLGVLLIFLYLRKNTSFCRKSGEGMCLRIGRYPLARVALDFSTYNSHFIIDLYVISVCVFSI